MSQANGFYGHIQRNDLRSGLMLLGFVIACQLIAIAILVGPLLIFDRANEPVSNFPGYFQRYGIAVFLASVVAFVVRYFLHIKEIRQNVNYLPVTMTDEPRFWKIVNLLAIAEGIPMPGLGIIDDNARNAFACGTGRKSAVVVVTRGLLQALDDEELEAVLAHEITHIVNGDIRLMAASNVMLQMLFWLKNNNPVRIEDGKQILLIVILPPFLILFLVSGFITSLAMTLGKLSRLMIASSREFIADAEAVRMTKNPAALISALKRIEGRSTIEGLDEAVDAMMIDGAVEGTYASHPTIGERIAALSQHAGAMVHANSTRKDTRTYTDLGRSPDGLFGRRMEVERTTTPGPKKLLIDRVNAGSGVNAFGLTPKMRNLVILAVAAPSIMMTVVYGDIKTRFLDFGGLQKQMMEPINNPGFSRLGDMQSSSGSGVLTRRARAKQLGRQDPLLARCFDTERYKVGDRGREIFRKPEQKLITRYVLGGKLPSSVTTEKYAAIRLISIDKVNEAVGQAELDKALLAYVNDREWMLMILHRFFGEQGYQWMFETYDSSYDRQVVDQLKLRLAANAWASAKKSKTKRLVQEAALLVDNPADFIPCYVRAGMDEPDTRQAQNRPAQKPLATSLRLGN